MSKRSAIYGVGINDSNTPIEWRNEGVVVRCQFYQKWKSMITRCYSVKLQQRSPSYKGCKVCDEWLLFSNFKKWMMNQDFKGKHLDKDIIGDGKLYSPDTCCFVEPSINYMVLPKTGSRGVNKEGVSFHKKSGKFIASGSVDSKRKHLGYFSTEVCALIASLEFKSSQLRKAAKNQEPRVKEGLIRHAEKVEIEVSELLTGLEVAS